MNYRGTKEINADMNIGPGDREVVKLCMIMGLLERSLTDPAAKNVASEFQKALSSLIDGERKRLSEIEKQRGQQS